MTATFTVEYWRDGDWYVGQLREVPGVFSQGKPLPELEEHLRDASRLRSGLPCAVALGSAVDLSPSPCEA